MKNSIIICLLGCVGLFMACGGDNTSNSKSSTSAGDKDLSGYEIMDYTSDGYQLAKNYHPTDGFVLSEGPLYKNKREGTWVNYYVGRDTGKIKTLTNYHQDNKSGMTLEFSNNGTITKRTDYDNGKLHGIYAEYKYNRPQKYIEYTHGEVNGMFKTFYTDGKKQQVTEYINGKKNGKSTFYNEEEQIILEYVYKNDEKLSGGKVEVQTVPEEK